MKPHLGSKSILQVLWSYAAGVGRCQGGSRGSCVGCKTEATLQHIVVFHRYPLMQILVDANPSKNVNTSYKLERHGCWPRLPLPVDPLHANAAIEVPNEELDGNGRPLTPPPPLMIDYQDRSQINSDVAAVVCGVGCRRSEMREHRRALHCFARAMEIDMDQTGIAAPKMSLYLSNIAVSLEHMAEYDTSLEFCFRGLHAALASHSPRSLEVCFACEDIGLTYLAKGKHNMSSQWAQRSFDILVEHYGIDHEETARGLSQLGVLYRAHFLSTQPSVTHPLMLRCAGTNVV